MVGKIIEDIQSNREMSREDLHEVIKDCGLFIPTSTTISLEELLDNAWNRELIALEKLTPKGLLYFYPKILEKKKKAKDCFGLMHDPTNDTCMRQCKSQKQCAVITHIPSVEKLIHAVAESNNNVKEEKIVGDQKTQLIRKHVQTLKNEMKKIKNKVLENRRQLNELTKQIENIETVIDAFEGMIDDIIL